MIAIVYGSGLTLTLIALPLREFLGLGAVVMCTLSPRKTSPTLLVERATQLAQTGRAEGILALEAEVRRDAAEDPFLRQGIMLAVDGTEPDLIMDIPETEQHELATTTLTAFELWTGSTGSSRREQAVSTLTC